MIEPNDDRYMLEIHTLLLNSLERTLEAQGYNKQVPEGLYQPIHYALSLGGKRVRPLLCLLATRLYTFDLEESHKIAIALEVFHNFTLLHDDLMDRSPLRRGKLSVYCKWDEPTAILSGDAMSIEAYRLLGELKSSALLGQVLPYFNRMALEVCAGQQYDMSFETRDDVSVDEYLEMIRLKTAVFLGAALRLGALAGGAPAEEAELLDRLGQALGMAFQIQDDYLDTYGDEATFGKPIGGDILNAKKTLLLLYTRAHLGEGELAELERLMSLPAEAKAERIQGVRQLYTKAGADTYARGEIARLTREALELLDTIAVAEGRKTPLRALFDSLMNRQS